MKIVLNTERPGQTCAVIYPEDRPDRWSSFLIEVTRIAGTLPRVAVHSDSESHSSAAFLKALRDAAALAMEVHAVMNDPARLQAIAERVNTKGEAA